MHHSSSGAIRRRDGAPRQQTSCSRQEMRGDSSRRDSHFPAREKGKDIPRGELAISGRMPLPSNFRRQRHQRIRDRNLSIRAARTPRSACTLYHRRCPFVIRSALAAPPDLLARARRKVAWRQLAVLRGVPLTHEPRIAGNGLHGGVLPSLVDFCNRGVLAPAPATIRASRSWS